MKSFIFTVLLSWSAATFAGLEGWEQLSAPGMKGMWKSKSLKDVFISHLQESGEYPIEEFDSKLYIEGLPEVREVMHMILRIKDFRIEKHEARRQGERWVIKLEGSYLRRGSVPVRFCELHIFTKELFEQKQFQAPAPEASGLDCFAQLQEVLP
jgi:hypothetical protein